MTEIAGFTEEELREWIKSKEQDFTNASTYEDTAPHEYLLREELDGIRDLQRFQAFVKLIRQEGYEDSFYSKKFVYYVVDGKKHWTMGEPIESTKLINRDDADASYGEGDGDD